MYQELIKEVKELRILLACSYSGLNLYRDDGELQDNTVFPTIDFKRDNVETIKEKMQSRALAALKEKINER